VTDQPSKRDPRDLSHAEIALFAHELRGALTVIAGYSALLRHPLDAREESAALDGIERAIARADALCGEALAGRTPSPVKARVLESVSVRLLVEQAAADQHSATGRDVNVAWEPDDDIVISGDSQALARVLGNLIGNAIKYSPTDSAIDVRVCKDSRPFLGNTCVIEVADRGPGIPEEMRDLVFEPFERLERDAEAPGTGLGLAVVKNVVEAHDGRIQLGDRDGGGTVARVELPI
jgi:two-component system, OmpR family, sensor kinase